MSDDIVEYFEGVPIRRSGNKIVLSLGAASYKKILIAMLETGLSAHKIIAYSSRPCDKCLPDVTIFNSSAQPVKIKKGILFDHFPETNGINIFQQKKQKKCKKP